MPTSDVQEHDGHTFVIGEVDAGVGDILATSGENPVLEAPPVIAAEEPPPYVQTNVTLSRELDGAYCIRIVGPRLHLTAAEAARLAVDLTEASDGVAETRRKQGFDT